MTTWLLSMLGIGLLDVIVLHFTEHSKLNKTIKTVCSVIFILVVIYPIPSLINGKLDFDMISFDYSIEIDSSMTDIIHKNEIKLLEKAVENALAGDGYTAEISIDANFQGNDINITKVTASCENYDRTIIIKISEYLSIPEEYIYIDAKS